MGLVPTCVCDGLMAQKSKGEEVSWPSCTSVAQETPSSSLSAVGSGMPRGGSNRQQPSKPEQVPRLEGRWFCPSYHVILLEFSSDVRDANTGLKAKKMNDKKEEVQTGRKCVLVVE